MLSRRRAHFDTLFGVVHWVHPLPLPLGEVAERSEDGEGKHDHTIQNRPQDPLSHLR